MKRSPRASPPRGLPARGEAMNRAPWIAALLAAAGCVVAPARPPPDPVYTPPPAYAPPPPVAYQPAPPPVVVEAPPPVRAQVWYFGEHFVPDRFGGGWCYEDAAHVHDYYPDQPNVYVVD